MYLHVSIYIYMCIYRWYKFLNHRLNWLNKKTGY